MLSAASLLFAVLFAEGALRLVMPRVGSITDLRMFPAIYRTSDLLPFEMLPGAHDSIVRVDIDEPTFASDLAINSLGYREREFSVTKRPGSYRILVLGDSMILGWGVQADQALTRELELILRRRTGKDIEVINAAFASGYAPDTQYVYLKNKGLELKPDLVLSAFTVHNDLYDILYESERTLGSDGLPEKVVSKTEYVGDDHRRHGKSHPSIGQLLRQHSYIANLIKAFSNRFYPEYRTRQVRIFMSEPYSAEYMTAWGLIIRCFAGMEKLTRTAGVRHLALVIPASLQVQPDAWATLEIPFDRTLFDAASPQARFANGARHDGFDSLDLLAALREGSRSEPMYFKRDGHFSVAGHRVAARAIADEILRRGLIPRR